jgi:LDH2 family malate/lactate/ureidoglycolate dehydrogenase
MAVEPASFGDPGEFGDAVAAHLREVKHSRRRPGVDQIRLPGERSRAERTRRLAAGVPIEAAVLDELAGLARDMGIAAPESLGGAPPDAGPSRRADPRA